MEQTTAVFPLCSLTKSDGSRCTGAALPGMNFCFQHIGGRISHVRAASNYSPKLDLVPASNREAIQHNLSEIALAFSDGKIDIRTVNTYHRVYRTAEQNLTRWEKSNKDNEGQPMLPLDDNSTSNLEQVNTTSNLGAPCLAETWDHDAYPTNTTTDLVIPSEVEGPALHEATTTTSGAPFKRSLSGEEANTTTDLVIPGEVEGPALNDPSTTATPPDQDSTPDDDDEYDALKDKTLREGMTYKYPSVEYTYELRDRIHQRHQEHAARKRARELAKAQVAS